MSLDEILAGRRILLRTPRVADAEDLFASVTSDPKVTEYLSWTPHPDVDETRRVIRELFNRVLENCRFALEGRLTRYTVFPNLSPEPLDSLLYVRAMR